MIAMRKVLAGELRTLATVCGPFRTSGLGRGGGDIVSRLESVHWAWPACKPCCDNSPVHWHDDFDLCEVSVFRGFAGCLL